MHSGAQSWRYVQRELWIWYHLMGLSLDTVVIHISLCIFISLLLQLLQGEMSHIIWFISMSHREMVWKKCHYKNSQCFWGGEYVPLKHRRHLLSHGAFFGHVSDLEIFVPLYRWDSVPTPVWDMDINMVIHSDPKLFLRYLSRLPSFLTIHSDQQHTTWSTNSIADTSPTCPSQTSWPIARLSAVSILNPLLYPELIQ